MSLQSWEEVKAVCEASGTNFNTYTAAKTVIPALSLYTVKANSLYIGKMFKVTCLAGLSNIATTPGTVTFQVMMGTIVIFTTGAIQLNATAHTLLPIVAEFWLTCQIVGSGTTAKFMGQARVQGIQFTLTAAQVDAINTGGIFSAPATAPAIGTGFDSTIDNIMDFWTGFSISAGGNAIQVQQYAVEEMN